jgi:hypothetical protein
MNNQEISLDFHLDIPVLPAFRPDYIGMADRRSPDEIGTKGESDKKIY